MTHLVKQQATFALAAAALFVVMGVGMLRLQDVDFTIPLRSFNTSVARAEYSRFSGESFLSSVFSIFGGVGTTASDAQMSESVPVLLYHGIVQNPDRFSVTSALFKEQMYALKQAGYQTISIEDFIAFHRGEKKLPKRSFLLTFDDGRRDSYEGADPVLEALGFKAVMFVTAAEAVPDPKWLSNYYLSLKDVKKMIASGRWEIGSHAVQKEGGFVPISETEQGNFLSNKSWLADEQRLETDEEYLARLSYELAESKSGLENEYHVNVDAFAYPFGDYGQQTVNRPEAVADISNIIGAKYRVAFRQVWQHDGMFTLNYADDDRLRLKRLETPTDWTGAELLAYLENSFDKPLPFADDFTKDTGWRATWGTAQPIPGWLSLAASDTTGASVFLDGTRLWKNYTYRATLDWTAGSNVTLLARYRDGNNYLSCTFGNGYVSIGNTVDGKTMDLLRKENAVPVSSGSEVTLGMDVRDHTVTCLSKGSPVATASAPDTSGGIGIKTWDPERNVAKIHLKRVEVESLP